MGSRSGFDADLELDELQNVIDRGSGAVSVAQRQANAQYNLGLIGTATAGTLGTVAASSVVTVDANKDVASFRNVTGVNFDAGVSGTAGTYDVFPTTAAKGRIRLAAADSAGDTITTITNASQAAARTYTIPDAGASASFMMTAGAQSVSGAQTLTGGLTITTAGVTITDVDVALSATTGTKIGTATTQKLGFYNKAPVAQQATTGTVTGFTAGASTASKVDSTYTGNTGSAAYTVGDIVLALKNLGLMAA